MPRYIVVFDEDGAPASHCAFFEADSVEPEENVRGAAHIQEFVASYSRVIHSLQVDYIATLLKIFISFCDCVILEVKSVLKLRQVTYSSEAYLMH